MFKGVKTVASDALQAAAARPVGDALAEDALVLVLVDVDENVPEGWWKERCVDELLLKESVLVCIDTHYSE